MTFEELLDKIAYDYKHPEQMPDGSVNADKNGNRRMSELQEKYNLSALKVQKLLVTAGVYEPVKKDANFTLVQKLYKKGKAMAEIMEETGLSKATVNGFLPYERGVKDLDKLGVEISNDAARKRRQRENEELVKGNARTILSEYPSDDALWETLKLHDRETFVTASGERFHINALFMVRGKGDGSPDRSDVLIISAGKNIIRISKDEVIAEYHKALEMVSLEMAAQDAAAQEMAAQDAAAAGEEHTLGEYDEYLHPVFVYLGIIPGNANEVTTRRTVQGDKRCSCCGRSTNELYSVATFDDLLKLDAKFEEERIAKFSEDEKKTAESVKRMMSRERAYWEERDKELIEEARTSKAVEAFEEEGRRNLCKLCVQTIYDALKEGVMPPSARISGYDDISDDELAAFIDEDCESAEHDYCSASGEIYRADEFDNQSLFLFKAMDRKGITHSFAMFTNELPHADGDTAFLIRAIEVHKLTKAGRIAADNTDTDYVVENFKKCRAGEDAEHVALVGLVELIERILDTIRTETLSESFTPGSNSITISGRHYNINSLGTIIPTYVHDADNYMSMADRDWDGSEYGFLIDGKLFTGDEVALMFSSQEACQIKFYADDPTSVPLRLDEFMVQTRLSQNDLVDDTIELINMFTTNGQFEKEKDRENFRKLFEKIVMPKLKIYHESRPRGYGRLAAMEIIKKLSIAEGTEDCQQLVREVIW